jgi:hypothetical protein
VSSERYAVRPYFLLLAWGLVLVGIAAVVGERAAGIGGLAALAAQLAAVALLRPGMGAPQREFMARWLGGMGVRVLALGVLLTFAATERETLPPAPSSLGFLGVLLPLLFLETRFLR